MDNKVPCSEWRDPEDRAPFTFPYFEYCHPGYRSTDAVNTGDNDLCGDRQITGKAVIGERFCERLSSEVFRLQYKEEDFVDPVFADGVSLAICTYCTSFF